MAATSTDGRQAIRSFVEHEHHDLARGVDRIHETACEFTSLPANEMPARILGILHWVERTVKPHMAWEETWLYPQIDDRARTPWATRSIRYDHRQIGRRTDLLNADRISLEHGPTHAQSIETRCDLFALEALLRAHVEREERFLLPLLDRDPDAWTTAGS